MAQSIKRAAQWYSFQLKQCIATSSLLVTNACVTCSVTAVVRYLVVLEMLRRWNIADVHTAVICDSIVISASNWTPRLTRFNKI